MLINKEHFYEQIVDGLISLGDGHYQSAHRRISYAISNVAADCTDSLNFDVLERGAKALLQVGKATKRCEPGRAMQATQQAVSFFEKNFYAFSHSMRELDGVRYAVYADVHDIARAVVAAPPHIHFQHNIFHFGIWAARTMERCGSESQQDVMRGEVLVLLRDIQKRARRAGDMEMAAEAMAEIRQRTAAAPVRPHAASCAMVPAGEPPVR